MQTHDWYLIIENAGMTEDETKRFWANFDNVHFKNWSGKDTERLKNRFDLNDFGLILRAAFDWNYSPEGYAYWNEISIRSGTIIQGFKFRLQETPGSERLSFSNPTYRRW